MRERQRELRLPKTPSDLQDDAIRIGRAADSAGECDGPPEMCAKSETAVCGSGPGICSRCPHRCQPEFEQLA